MSEAERGKKAIFDQDSNPWVPWDPTKKIEKMKQESKQKKVSCGESRTPKICGRRILHPYFYPYTTEDLLKLKFIYVYLISRAMYFASSMRAGSFYFPKLKNHQFL